MTSIDGQYTGEGSYVYATGNRYDGAWLNGKRHGRGRFTFANGTEYVGNWSLGLKEGSGVLTWADGQYIGNWSQGYKHGKGQQRSCEDQLLYQYSGDFCRDKYHGQGNLLSCSKDRTTDAEAWSYAGSFKEGLRHGSGKMVWADGRKYEGSFIHGQQEGYGIYRWPDGARFVGQWRCNDPVLGIYTRADGEQTHYPPKPPKEVVSTENSELQQKTGVCGICFEDRQLLTLPCKLNHSYCSDCLHSSVVNDVGQNMAVRCPTCLADGVCVQFTSDDMKCAGLSQETVLLLADMELRKCTADLPSCGSCGKAFYETGDAKQQRRHVCPYCAKNPFQTREDERANHGVDEYMCQSGAFVCQSDKCGAILEWASACNLIKCSLCNTKQCWFCTAVIEDHSHFRADACPMFSDGKFGPRCAK